jgi:long-subunit fatty acid transport protein
MTATVLRASILAAIVSAMFATPGLAQSTDDGSEFDFSLPGARARGMGGAFVAIADDASSVYSNPAGLTSLFRPEVSIEARVWNLRYFALDRGHAFGNPTGRGYDTIAGVEEKEFSNTIFYPAFISVVYPSGRWALGLYHHRLVSYEMDHEVRGIYFDCNGGGRGPTGAPPFCEQGVFGDGIDRIFPQRQSYKLGITGSGGGFAFNVTDGFKLGVSAQVFHFDIQRQGLVYGARGEHKFAAPDWSHRNIEIFGVRTGKDWGFGVNAGALWDLSSQFTIGGTFRQGQTFHYRTQSMSGAANGADPGILFLDNKETPFRVPDTWAAGVAFKPSNAWRIGFEYDLVKYSQLKDNYVNTSLPEEWPEAQVLRDHVKVDDSHQFRVGGEYSRTVGGQLLSFRAGLWSDPFHQPYFEITDPATGLPSPQWALTLPKRDDQMHYSGGFGMATPRRLQIDFAIDHSKSVTTYSVSSILRF